MLIRMALKVSRAGTVAQPRFVRNVLSIAAGAVAAAVLTEYARSEVYDVPFDGGDLLYGTVGAGLTLMLMSGTTGRMLAAGMMAGGTISTLNTDFNLL